MKRNKKIAEYVRCGLTEEEAGRCCDLQGRPFVDQLIRRFTQHLKNVRLIQPEVLHSLAISRSHLEQQALIRKYGFPEITKGLPIDGICNFAECALWVFFEQKVHLDAPKLDSDGFRVPDSMFGGLSKLKLPD